MRANAAPSFGWAVAESRGSLEKGVPWENGSCETLNTKLCDEALEGEPFYSPREPQAVNGACRWNSNMDRPNFFSNGYRLLPPAFVRGTPVPASFLGDPAATLSPGATTQAKLGKA